MKTKDLMALLDADYKDNKDFFEKLFNKNKSVITKQSKKKQ